VHFLETVDEIERIGAHRAIFVAGATRDALFQNFGRLSLHEFFNLFYRFFLVIVHILTPDQAISTQVTLFLIPHLASSGVLGAADPHFVATGGSAAPRPRLFTDFSFSACRNT
jgi:hypothetical protein